MSLTIQVRQTTVVTLAGRLDTSSAPRAEQALGPVLAAVTVNDLGWSIYTGFAVAAAAPTATYDVIALVRAFLLQAKDDPRSWVVILKDLLVAALTALLPWRK